MTQTINPDDEQAAYAAFRQGELEDAAARFTALVTARPDVPTLHYMLGLVHKYRRDWKASLHHNLRSLDLHDAPDESSLWNAAIAATALGDWEQARACWTAACIRLPDGDGPIEDDYGVACVRLDPGGSGETVFARRLSPAHARLLNVPLPASGYRFGDIVLHDGARTGARRDGDQEVPVFNALQRLAVSPYRTHVAFVRCRKPEDVALLQHAEVDGIGYLEDWTGSMRQLCLRCSYGAPHVHADGAADEREWNAERTLGIAARDRAAVEALLDGWRSRFRGRIVEGIEVPEHEPASPPAHGRWWDEPEAVGDGESGS